MNQSSIYVRLKEVFDGVFHDDSIELGPSLSAKDVEGWDSLAHIRLMLAIQRAFKVKFSTSEIGSLETVGELVELIEARVE